MTKSLTREHVRKVAGTVIHYNDDRDGIRHATEYLIEQLNLDVAHEWELPTYDLAADDLMNLPSGAIIIDRYGNPYRMEGGHLGHFITMGMFPFTLIYLPKEQP